MHLFSRRSHKKDVLKNFAKFTGKPCARVSCKVIEKETLTQKFSCEFFKKFSEHLFYKTPADECFKLSSMFLAFDFLQFAFSLHTN